jgi:hypothetical protein
LNESALAAVRPFFDWGNAFTSRKAIPAKYGYCGLAFRSLGILSDGRVVLCCGDCDGDTSLGNLAEYPLSDLLPTVHPFHAIIILAAEQIKRRTWRR